MKAAGTLIVALYVIALTGGLLAQPQVRSTVPAGGPNTQYYDNAALRSLPVPIQIRSDINRGDVIARGNRVATGWMSIATASRAKTNANSISASRSVSCPGAER